MNTTRTRYIVSSFAASTAVAAALTALTAIGPTVASAERDDSIIPAPGEDSARSARALDLDQMVAYRKALMSQYYVDHARELGAAR